MNLTLGAVLSRQVLTSGPFKRSFWTWLNSVFNTVDHERIKEVGPDRAAAEWLLRCGAAVRFKSFDKWHKDYNHLPSGPPGRLYIEAIDGTDSCIFSKGFDYLDGLQYVLWLRFHRCMYISDTCLERLATIDSIVASLQHLEVKSCGNVTDRGICALHTLRNLQSLILFDLPGIKNQGKLVQTLKKSLPSCNITLDPGY
uniref:ATP synthase subunit s, mitochondrial n=1 Tax=Myxine glutinosa TaxID=7769 RepID=UPI00358F7743